MKVSIITVCLNSKNYIEESIRSVLGQSYGDIDYVLIDGASSDGTLEIIDRYKEHISTIISEQDTGIYNAMNKGINLSRGDIIFFLNSDDKLIDNHVISDVVGLFVKNDIDLLCGDILYKKNSKSIIIKGHAEITRQKMAASTLPHQAVFARKSLFDTVGLFDEKLPIVADYDWLLRALLGNHCNYYYYARKISLFSAEGISNQVNFESERRSAMKKYFSTWEIFLYRSLPLFLKKIKNKIL